MKYEKINRNLFIKNRKSIANNIEKKSLAIINSNDIMPTNSDGTMPFIQNSDLFWLSGIDQEESVLMLCPDHHEKSMREILFLKETNEHIAVWEGAKLTKKKAFENSGINSVFWLKDLERVLDSLLEKVTSVYLNKNIHNRATKTVQTRDDRFRLFIKSKYPKKEIKEIAPLLHKYRAIKSSLEIDLIQNACNITEKGFRRILPFIKPGVMEYEIEAELIHEFISSRSSRFAYQPIIGSGRNSCVLHYIENNKQCQEGDVILMDFGAEYANYASDLTRTVPVNGVFTKRQASIYSSVLHVMKEAVKMLRPGTMLKDYNIEVGKIMEGELVKLKLLDRHDIKKQNPKFPLYKKYFMHGTSHFLGLDVHDVGSFDDPIRAGMVFTCEPGIYILDENIGVRLENDILITENGADDLMKNIPIEIEEIELLMNN
jgi:Xaa-Pro aminopeptidase